MPRKSATLALCLTDEMRATLSALARSRTAQAHHVERSAIILQLADKRDATEIAAKLRIDRQRVTRCARRVMAVGPLKAVDDLPRSGRRPDITAAARAWLIGEACLKAKQRGYPHELWTLRLLATHAREHGPAAGHACLAELAPSTVHEVLNSQPVKPHKVRYYLQRRDPTFEERKAEVLEVYAAAEMQQRRCCGRSPRPTARLPCSPMTRSPASRRLPVRPPTCRRSPASMPRCSVITSTSGSARSPYPLRSTW